MSAFVRFVPTTSTTKITQLVRIDNDFRLTVGINTGGTVSYSFYNFMGIPSDYTYTPNPADDNVVESQLAKDGSSETLVTTIKMFYNESDQSLAPEHIPRAWTYGEAIDKDNYLPGTLPDSVNQSFPLVIWDTVPDGENYSTQVNNAMAPAVLGNSLYTRLGTVAARRLYLRNKIFAILRDPDLMWLLGGGTMGALAPQSVNSQTPTDVIFTFSQKVQGFWFWLEIITRAISHPTNLQGANGERNFNLLDGELSLDIVQLIGKIPTTLPGNIADVASRPGWDFRRFGSVSSSSPYAYTAPSYNQDPIPSHLDTTINIGSMVPSAVTTNWLSWLRSLV